MTTPDLSPAEVERPLARAFLTATVPDPESPGTPGRPAAEDSAEAVAVAMRIVGPVLEAREAADLLEAGAKDTMTGDPQ